MGKWHTWAIVWVFLAVDFALLGQAQGQTTPLASNVRVEFLAAERRLSSGDASSVISIVGPLAVRLEDQGDIANAAVAYGLVGLAYMALGNSRSAHDLLQYSKQLADKAGLPDVGARSDFNDAMLSVRDFRRALDLRNGGTARAYLVGSLPAAVRKAGLGLIDRLAQIALRAERRGNSELEVSARTVAGRIATDLGEWRTAREQLTVASRRLGAITGRSRTEVTLALGDALLGVVQSGAGPDQSWARETAFGVLEPEARDASDSYEKSYANGLLGLIAASHGDHKQGLGLTRAALAALTAGKSSTQVTSLEIRWRGQVAGLLNRLNRRQEAIAAYEGAYRLLDRVRPAVAQVDPISGLSFFRQTAEPILLAYTELLIDAPSADAEVSLLAAREKLETYKALQLENYFQEACRSALAQSDQALEKSQIGASALVVYPILFEDRLEMIVSAGGKMTRVRNSGAPRAKIEARADAFRRALQERRGDSYIEPAQDLYDWLIGPLEPILAANAGQITTLVIIPDAALRTIPLAALRDRKTGQFLVEKIPIATSIGLTLPQSEANPGGRRALFVGVTKPVQDFDPLPGVKNEIVDIRKLVPGPVLLDSDFTPARLERILTDAPFSIIHMATHASFGGTPEDSYIVTAGGRLTLPDLDDIIERSRIAGSEIELMTLSACETALGNDEAVLGIAGVAFKAGARSVLASLWKISDEAAAQLTPAFYRALTSPGADGKARGKAEALQEAQLAFLHGEANSVRAGEDFRQPYYWAPFILVGNWQ